MSTSDCSCDNCNPHRVDKGDARTNGPYLDDINAAYAAARFEARNRNSVKAPVPVAESSDEDDE